MTVTPGDEISVRENSRSIQPFQELPNVIVPDWLSADPDNLKGSVMRIPERHEIDVDVEETLIVELYSR